MKERTSHLCKLKDKEHSDGKHGVQECCDRCLVGGFSDAEDSRQNRWLILLGCKATDFHGVCCSPVSLGRHRNRRWLVVRGAACQETCCWSAASCTCPRSSLLLDNSAASFWVVEAWMVRAREKLDVNFVLNGLQIENEPQESSTSFTLQFSFSSLNCRAVAQGRGWLC